MVSLFMFRCGEVYFITPFQRAAGCNAELVYTEGKKKADIFHFVECAS